MVQISSTVYRDGREPKIGMTINDTADMTVSEVNSLIDYLQDLVRHVNNPYVHKKPNGVQR